MKKIAQKGDKRERSSEEQIDMFLKGEDFQAVAKNRGFGNSSKSNLETKVVANITGATSFTETNGRIPLEDRQPGVFAAPRRPALIQDLVSKGVTNSDNVSVVYRSSENAGAVMQAEAGAFGQSDKLFTSALFPVQKITDYTKVGVETLADVDFIRSEIMELLQYDVPRLLETQLFGGTGLTIYLHGLSVTGYSKGYTLTGITGVVSPNKLDACAAAMSQVRQGNTADVRSTGFNPTAILLHPDDITAMQLEKSTVGEYIFPNFLMGNVQVGGVPIYPYPDLTAGQVLVGDFSRAKLYVRQEIEVRMWEQHDTDATHGLITFTATKRCAFVVTVPDAFAFVYDSLATIKTAIQ
jgi:HK97 family phage major capsid protein